MTQKIKRKEDVILRGIVTLIVAGIIGFLTMSFTTYVRSDQIINEIEELKHNQEKQGAINKQVAVQGAILVSMVKTLDSIKQSIKALDNRQRKIHLELKVAINGH